MDDYSQIITVEAGKRSGKPCLRGSRFAVADLFSYLASGMTQEEIKADFPQLSDEDFLACFALAADVLGGRVAFASRQLNETAAG